MLRPVGGRSASAEQPLSLSNFLKIACITSGNLFGLYFFFHQSCATGTLILEKENFSTSESKGKTFFDSAERRKVARSESILKNLCQICGNVFFTAYLTGDQSRAVAESVDPDLLARTDLVDVQARVEFFDGRLTLAIFVGDA